MAADGEPDGLMFVVVVGGGKVGGNVARSLVEKGHEVVIVEQTPGRAATLERDLGHRVVRGDGTELYVLERAGVRRPPDIVVAVTGDDEDNIVICQLAREKYGVDKVIARVNDPRNQAHFDLLEIAPTISATETILALIEHEVPEHGLVHLLQLRRENLEIVELEIAHDSPAAGRRVEDLRLPPNARLISVIHDGRAEIVVGSTELAAGDQVLAILERGADADLLAALAGRKQAGGRRRREPDAETARRRF